MIPNQPKKIKEIPFFYQKNSFFVLIGTLIYLGLSFGSMAMMNIGGVIFFLTTGNLWLKKTAWKTWQKDSLSKISKFFPKISLILLTCCFISLIQAYFLPIYYANKTFTVKPFDFLKAWYFFIPFLLAITLKTFHEKIQEKICCLWLFFSGIMSLFGIFQIFIGQFQASRNPSIPYLFQTTLLFHHHLSTANILIFPFFAALAFTITYISSAPKVSLLYTSIAFLNGIVLFFTWSRNLWLSLPIGFALWSMHALKKTFHVSYSFIISLNIAIGTGILTLSQIPGIKTRLTSLSGASDRWYLWKANWIFFLTKPFFGVGWRKGEALTPFYFEETYPTLYKNLFIGHAHNMIIENLACIGLIGTIAWIIWSFTVLKMALKKSQLENIVLWKTNLSWGLFCAWIVFFINGLTQVNFWEGKCLHQMMISLAWILI